MVHHLIFNYVNPLFEKQFIYESYSCRFGEISIPGISLETNVNFKT